MQAIDNIEREARHQYIGHINECLYPPPPVYRVHFSSVLPDDKVVVIDYNIHVPESQAYKWIFFNNQVNDKTIQHAINHAIKKVNMFIDNYKA